MIGWRDGGMRFGKDGWVYNTFREWVRGGARWTAPGTTTVGLLVGEDVRP